jgi:hypothetical protein
MNLKEDEIQLYTEFGIAAEKAQVLEVEAGNVALSFIALFVDTKKIGDEEREMFRSIVDDVNRKTLGALLKSIKTWANFDDSLLEIIDEALERRNYLTHRFFPTHNFAIFNESGRLAMIEELKGIQTKLDSAHRSLAAISSVLTKFAGRNDVSEETAQKLIARGRSLKI